MEKSKSRPQTIQIFLPDGSPRSVKIAEITNRVVKSVLLPRNKLEYMAGREELKNVGIYFLFGETDESAKPNVYIGEAEDCFKRLKQHNKTKDFWNYAIVMVSKINTFTKSHVKYLEYIAVKEANDSQRYSTENATAPNKPHVTESMEADLLDSFDTIKILLSTLGFPVFDKISKEQFLETEIFTLNGRGVKAEGDLVDDGFVIFKGSQAKKETVPSCHQYLINLRKNLIQDGVLEEKDDNYHFTEDYIFNSPSTAGGVILGRSTNGWTKWKSVDSKTLGELRRK